MKINERQKQILEILNKRNYVTVKELSVITFTSESSIRRDLTFLQNNGLVKRLHGGVSSVTPLSNVASIYDRAHKNVKEKRIIAQKASQLFKDGQTILLDSSTTASFLIPYISKYNNITVFTNNISTALNSIESGVKTHCLGGCAINGSVVLSGAETFNAIYDLTVDLVFFSSQSLDNNGNISDATEEENYIRKLMLKSAKTKIFLCDCEKFDKQSTYKLCNLNEIDYAIFNCEYPELNTKCKMF